MVKCKCPHNIRATYGTLETGSTCCKHCKTPEMKYQCYKKCFSCKKDRASYGLDGKVEYCIACKTDEMYNPYRKKCIACNEKEASFGTEWKHPTHCKKCASTKMTDVIHKRCEVCNIIRASLGTIWNRPTHCESCAPNDLVDVVNKRCEVCKITIASFGTIWNRPTHCQACAPNEMVCVHYKRCEGCKETGASFGIEWKRPTHCAECKSPNMNNVITKRCISELCDTLVSGKFDGYCYRCFAHLFPEHILSQNYKTKEKTVGSFILEQFPDVASEIKLDKKIDNGCSRRRPDIFLDRLSHVLIIEVDEHRHNNTPCENKRMMEISQDLDHRPVVCLRFNPDGYRNNDGKYVPSPWKQTKNGCVISKEHLGDWTNRLQVLKERYEYWLTNVPDKTLTVEHLFY